MCNFFTARLEMSLPQMTKRLQAGSNLYSWSWEFYFRQSMDYLLISKDDWKEKKEKKND